MSKTSRNQVLDKTSDPRRDDWQIDRGERYGNSRKSKAEEKLKENRRQRAIQKREQY